MLGKKPADPCSVRSRQGSYMRISRGRKLSCESLSLTDVQVTDNDPVRKALHRASSIKQQCTQDWSFMSLISDL